MDNSVVMLNAKEIEVQNIDHLGIVAGIIDAIGIVENSNLCRNRAKMVSSAERR